MVGRAACEAIDARQFLQRGGLPSYTNAGPRKKAAALTNKPERIAHADAHNSHCSAAARRA
jgi:hypothetical protein